jgi:hypothetical protein
MYRWLKTGSLKEAENTQEDHDIEVITETTMKMAVY